MLSDVYEQLKRERYADTHEFETPEDEAEFMRHCEENEDNEQIKLT